MIGTESKKLHPGLTLIAVKKWIVIKKIVTVKLVRSIHAIIPLILISPTK